MISVTSAESTVTKIELTPLRDPSFVLLLRSFRNMLKSSVGPNGNLKLLVSGGGYVQISACSSHVIQHYDQYDSPIIKFIVQIMKGQSDFGLYCGLLVTSGLENMLSLQINKNVTAKQSIEFFNILIKSANNIFTSDKLKIRVSFDTIMDFIPLVQSVLMSKCSSYFHKSSLMELCVQIVKAFLFSLDVERGIIGQIRIQVFSGNKEFTFLPGIVYQLTEDDDWISNFIKQKSKNKTSYTTICFTTALDNSDECKEHDVNIRQGKMTKIFEILEKAIALGVDLVVCQKVVDSDVVLFLRRKSVVILERLGTVLVNDFQQLTGSFPISDINKLSADDVSSLTGTIDSISTVIFSEKLYLLMQSQSTSVGTLMLKTPCLTGSQQIKNLVEQALKSLRGLVSEPFVCPGAGCFEMCFFLHLQEMCRKEIPVKHMKWLLSALLEASGCSLPIWVDSCYNHAWSCEEQARCNCRMISRDTISSYSGTYYFMSLNDEVINGDVFSDSATELYPPVTLTSDAIVDSFMHKQNSIIVSFETCINLLNIGTVVCKRT